MKVKYMKNKIKNIIGSSLILLSISCLPDIETTSSSSSTTSVSSLSSSISQSETTVEQQVTTSGSPPITETSDSDTSEFDTIVMTISADSNCGDGLIEFPEECDDRNTIAEDSCDDSCFKTRFVFRSFESIPSNFGGTFFADGLCAMNAKRAKLDGEYKAWVSDADLFSAPKFRFNSTDFQGWYLLPTNPPKKLAKGWEGLTTEFLVNWIDVSAAGVESILTPEFTWTGTLQDGTFSEGNTCNGWTTTDPSSKAQIGSVGNWNKEWTESKIVECGFDKKIYCFQVD